jgi:large subunit ribosomal protein L20
MPRVKRGFTKHRRHHGILAMVKGHRTSRGHLYRTARQELMRSLYYAYRDRRTRKRDMRSLWIVRINAAARQHGLPYNRFISGLLRLGIQLDRKVLADLAVRQPLAFAALVYQVRGETMPAEVQARYTPAPATVAPVTPAAPAAPPAAPVTPAAAIVPEPSSTLETVADEEAAASGDAPEQDGTADPVEEGHGDSQQGTSR